MMAELWDNRLKAMSLGPLWVLREPAPLRAAPPSSELCPVCSTAWLQAAADSTTTMIVLAAPLSDAAQRTLLQNCLRMAGLEQAAQFYLHGDCSPSAESALQVLQTQIVELGVRTLIVFGDAAAQRISSDLRRGQLQRWNEIDLIVTWHPAQMLADPILKAQVWADLCLAARDA